jgi:hypothetical protein
MNRMNDRYISREIIVLTSPCGLSGDPGIERAKFN